ncbi:unnamed protein product [Owenia fusiformis]|uniref:Uncharacterized protein n=1 Tax=Owenia fusiformis TaxID=6347 RepID=A0A8S4NNP6_OWEFU|nr:unnamed protein product [Owenia fusiformis]
MTTPSTTLWAKQMKSNGGCYTQNDTDGYDDGFNDRDSRSILPGHNRSHMGHSCMDTTLNLHSNFVKNVGQVTFNCIYTLKCSLSKHFLISKHLNELIRYAINSQWSEAVLHQ